jgi:hypothetical protein
MPQPHRACLLFGIFAGLGFIATWLVLGALLANYNPVTQTISEIGEKGSAFEVPYKIANLIVAGCFLLFFHGVYRFSAARQLSLVPAFMLDFFALTQLGVSAFESPQPLAQPVWDFEHAWLLYTSRPGHHMAWCSDPCPSSICGVPIWLSVFFGFGWVWRSR